jgi:hypothetical protein
VHKLTENARFFAQKPPFLHIFAGGRDDFLAGPKTPIFVIFGSRERPRPRQDFAPKILPDGSAGFKQRKIFFPCRKIKFILFLKQNVIYNGKIE